MRLIASEVSADYYNRPLGIVSLLMLIPHPQITLDVARTQNNNRQVKCNNYIITDIPAGTLHTHT